MVWVNTGPYLILPKWNVGTNIGESWTCTAKTQVIEQLHHIVIFSFVNFLASSSSILFMLIEQEICQCQSHLPAPLMNIIICEGMETKLFYLVDSSAVALCEHFFFIINYKNHHMSMQETKIPFKFAAFFVSRANMKLSVASDFTKYIH